MDENLIRQVGRPTLGLIPSSSELPEILGIESCIPNYHLVFSQMLDPLKDALSISGKKLRFEIVEIAFKALGGILNDTTRRQLKVCDQIIEGLHLGSMIIDDIQDRSEIRRGRPTFHRKYGISVALNAGNWLYFQAIDQIQALGLDVEQEIGLLRRLNGVLLKAHFGQGLDVGVNMNVLDQSEVESTYFTAAELKTGALMALAFDLGATVAGSATERPWLYSKQIKTFGIALQILDDIGNFLAPPPKGKEDLKAGRPSFIWVIAARLASPADYERFKFATRMLPDTSFIDSWSGLFDLIPHSKAVASHYLEGVKTELLQACVNLSKGSTSILSANSLKELKDQVESIFTKLEKAYG